MIETLFEPFDYITVSYNNTAPGEDITPSSSDSSSDWLRSRSQLKTTADDNLRITTPGHTRSSTHSFNGSHPLPSAFIAIIYEPQAIPGSSQHYSNYFTHEPAFVSATPSSFSRQIQGRRGSTRSTSIGRRRAGRTERDG